MYSEHFGLNFPPFKITPDTQLFYPGGKRGLILEALVYAIESGEGIIKVVGEVGSGKTMLCRMLEEKLPKHIEIVYLLNPRLTPDMILHAIALELRLPVTPQTSRFEVMQMLQTKLLEKHAAKQQVVIFVEEAQGMPLETLEEIRLLSNLETHRSKLLQIVLFGQPELDTNLSATHIRQLKERITHSFNLPPFTAKDIAEYVHFRMQAVGYRGPQVFSKASIRLLAKISHGLLRRINILADKALLVAFSENTYYIKPRHIKLAARDSDFSYSSVPFYLLISVLIVLFLVLIPHFFNMFPVVTEEAPMLQPVSPMPASKPEETKVETLSSRLQATEQWLNTAKMSDYTIQIMQTNTTTKALEKFLQKSDIQPLLPKLYLAQNIEGKQDTWGIFYHQFSDSESAIQAIQELPASLQANQPFVRTIGSFR